MNIHYLWQGKTQHSISIAYRSRAARPVMTGAGERHALDDGLDDGVGRDFIS
jgi:hypothetical protein